MFLSSITCDLAYIDWSDTKNITVLRQLLLPSRMSPLIQTPSVHLSIKKLAARLATPRLQPAGADEQPKGLRPNSAHR